MSKRTRPYDPRHKRRRLARLSIARYWRTRFRDGMRRYFAGEGQMAMMVGVSFIRDSDEAATVG